MFREKRIAGLDNWRAVLMLAGIFFHATSVQESDLTIFVLIADMSSNFRMGAFFTIAGLLSLLSLDKHGPDSWLSRRLFQIGVPALFGLLVLGPMMSACFTWRVLGTLVPVVPSLGWWHFWFLCALLVCAPATWWLARADRAHGLFARIDARIEALPVPATAIIAGVGLMSMLCATLFALAAHALPAIGPQIWGARMIVIFAPLYVFGALIAGCPMLGRRVTASGLPALGIVLGLLALRLGAKALFGTSQVGALDIFTASMCPPAIAVLILQSAARIRSTPAIMSRLSKAAFTIYMVHYPIILLLDTMLDRLGVGPYAGYALTVIGTGALSYAIHWLIVGRFQVAAMLLNGVKPERPDDRSRCIATQSDCSPA